jgi:hypothetical protein
MPEVEESLTKFALAPAGCDDGLPLSFLQLGKSYSFCKDILLGVFIQVSNAVSVDWGKFPSASGTPDNLSFP